MVENRKTGYELEKRTHFNDIVGHYDKIRPEYPGELFEDVIAFTGVTGLNGTNKKNALEIGAGTGKATAPFLDAGYYNVTVIEVTANMAEFLRERFKENKDFNVMIAAFEEAVLNESSYDLIYAANAFHWVDAEIGCPKAFRLLRSGGVFALFRYSGVQAVFEERYEKIRPVYDKYYRGYYNQSERTLIDVYGQPAQILRRFGFSDLKDYGFDDITMKLYKTTLLFSAEEYIALLETYSDHRHLPEENKAVLYAAIKDIILQNGGYYEADYTFQLYMGRKL
jgi:SAM-dependent methyltransferase